MKTVCGIDECNGCMACISVCPRNCISIKDDIFNYNAVVDQTRCIKCKICEKVCPNISAPIKITPNKWLQGWAKEEIRQRASSGGIASEIVRTFILSGGYVASCLFEKGKFIFEITNDLEIAKRFAGSKYVKSNPVGIYEKVKERLKTDKVLFVGLPCQVAALKNYITEQENLYTVDLICHGTPSPQILEYYLAEHKADLKTLCDISFRCHNSYRLSANCQAFNPEGVDDYLLSFLSASIYTENCYSCKYASFDRVSDITLGDSWGTEYITELAKGVSLMLIQTPKGEELIGKISAVLLAVNIDTSIEENAQLREPVKKTPSREVFLNAIKNTKSFRIATLKVFPIIIIKRWIKRILYKMNLYQP